MQLSDRDAYFEDRDFLKWILGRYRYAIHEYEMLQELEAKLKAQRLNPSGTGKGYDDMPHASGSPSNLPESQFIQLQDLEDKIARKSADNERILNQTFEIVDCIQEQTPEHNVLMGYYVHSWTWAQVSERLHYSEPYCRKLRDKALDMLLACSPVRYIMFGFRPAYEHWCLSQKLNGGHISTGGPENGGGDE